MLVCNKPWRDQAKGKPESFLLSINYLKIFPVDSPGIGGETFRKENRNSAFSLEHHPFGPLGSRVNPILDQLLLRGSESIALSGHDVVVVF